ncbi:MAG: hypothetical protein E7812_01750 [Phenylobacterium sp.]|nr:MAG: hypothetical protein E7812_01750 [Phenylobacterium sp.]
MTEPTPKRSRGEARARRKTERAIGKPLPKTLHCSFCGTSQHKVEKLIAGPRGVFICNACVSLCDNIISGRPLPLYAGFAPLEQPTEELVEMVGSVALASDANRDFLQSLVDTLRGREVSWAAIAEQLGVSRQSAWERFS